MEKGALLSPAYLRTILPLLFIQNQTIDYGLCDYLPEQDVLGMREGVFDSSSLSLNLNLHQNNCSWNDPSWE
jgi:hypothetical protein